MGCPSGSLSSLKCIGRWFLPLLKNSTDGDLSEQNALRREMCVNSKIDVARIARLEIRGQAVPVTQREGRAQQHRAEAVP
jgi:hypothetical protein